MLEKVLHSKKIKYIVGIALLLVSIITIVLTTSQRDKNPNDFITENQGENNQGGANQDGNVWNDATQDENMQGGDEGNDAMGDEVAEDDTVGGGAAEGEGTPEEDEQEANREDEQGTSSEDINDNENQENESNKEEEDTQEEEVMTPPTTVAEYLNLMTLEEKIYQLFIVSPESLAGNRAIKVADETLKDALREKPVGGFIYFAYNLIDEVQTTEMLQTTTQYGYDVEGMPLFLCVDEEGGRVARINNNPAFIVPEVEAMANINTTEDARNTGAIIGEYLKRMGFNWNFAPVADVLTIADNIIGDRSFGSEAQQVKELAVALADGLKSQGIMSTFKHFPGHGATQGDTHEGYSLVDKNYEELKQAELIPFAAAQDAAVDAIMVAHVSVPKIIGDNTPCTLSEVMITDILRGDLRYEGLVITDAMSMGAIVNNYTCAEATVKAIEAGVDVILMPQDLDEAVEGIKQAIKAGRLTEERINESVRRILEAKIKIMSEK